MLSTYYLEPFKRLGKIILGSSQQECREAIGISPETFHPAGLDTPTDSFDQLGLQLTYSRTGTLELIEAFAPAVVEFNGVVLSQSSLDGVLENLRELRIIGLADEAGFDFPEYGFGLYSSDKRTIEAVSIYAKGYNSL